MLEATCPAFIGELGVPGLHQCWFLDRLAHRCIAPLRMMVMRRSPATSLLAVLRDAVLLGGALLVAAALEILLVQLIGRDHLYAVLEGNFGPSVMVDSLLHMPQFRDDFLLDGDQADVSICFAVQGKLWLDSLRARLAQ